MKIPLPLNIIQVFTRKDYNALSQRALALWGMTYPMAHSKQLFSEAELLALMKNHTPAYGRRIIRAAVELKLLTKGRRRDGKTVYHRIGSATLKRLYLNGDRPGKLIYIEVADLAEKSLQRLRSVLHHTFAAAKPRIRSRAVQAKTTGFTEQTTRNWSRVLKAEGTLHVKPNHYIATSPYSGKQLVIAQAPNTYIPHLYDVRSDNPQQAWEDTSRRDYNPTSPTNTRHMRLYYEDAASAAQTWKHRQRKGIDVHAYWPQKVKLEGRTYNGLCRAKPYSAKEIPEAIMVADEHAYDAETNAIMYEQEYKLNHLQRVELMLRPELALLLA